MARPDSCPPPADLQRLALGQVSESAAERLGQHLIACAACQTTLQGIEKQDTLVSALRHRSVSLPRPQNAVVKDLVEQMKKLGEAPTGTPDPGAQALEPIEFLSPPEGPNELGRLGG